LRRRGILLALVGIALLVVGVLFVSVILRQTVARPVEPTARPPITVPVVVTTRDIPLRTLLKESDLALIQVPVELVPLNAVSEVSAVVGKITKIPLVAGEMFMRHHLADPTKVTGQDLAFLIGDDQVVMAFPATDLMSQINVLKPGDLVDILVSVNIPVLPSEQQAANDRDAAPEDRLFTFNALQRVELSAIVVEIQETDRARTTTASGSRTAFGGAQPTPTPSPTPELSEIKTRAILVALAPQDALVLKHLLDAGGVVDIVLRAPTSAQTFQLNPVTSEYLKDRYELVIER